MEDVGRLDLCKILLREKRKFKSSRARVVVIMPAREESGERADGFCSEGGLTKLHSSLLEASREGRKEDESELMAFWPQYS